MWTPLENPSESGFLPASVKLFFNGVYYIFFSSVPSTFLETLLLLINILFSSFFSIGFSYFFSSSLGALFISDLYKVKSSFFSPPRVNFLGDYDSSCVGSYGFATPFDHVFSDYGS